MSESNTLEVYLKWLAFALLAAFALVFATLLFLLGVQPWQVAGNLINALFALDSVQALWYLTRAAGVLAYLMLWLSTAWGLAVTSKIFDPLLHRAFTYDMHQYLSLLAIGFTVLHVGVLLADRYLPFSVAQILVPFIAPYRPIWVGVGVIGLYLTLLVTVTFYFRRWIGQKTFRVIHISSFAAYAAVTLHGLLAGTDSVLWAMQLIYAGTFLVIVFLTVYWVMFNWLDGREKPRLEMGSRTLNPYERIGAK
jgi:sulfoxide reductase heme-binding subunit YedZ